MPSTWGATSRGSCKASSSAQRGPPYRHDLLLPVRPNHLDAAQESVLVLHHPDLARLIHAVIPRLQLELERVLVPVVGDSQQALALRFHLLAPFGRQDL